MLTHRSFQAVKRAIGVPLRQISASTVRKCEFVEQGNATRELVLLEIDDKSGYATLSLNRPPVNTFNLDLLNAFSKALDDVEEQKCRGMILTSTIPKIFSVGFDVRELWHPDEERLREFWRVVQDCWIKLYASTFPNVAAINGLNSAGACFFTMSCEYRVMVPRSKIGLSGARLGIAIPLPLILTMQNIIGAREADLAITSGKLYSSEDALRVGLIDEIAADKADALLESERFLNRFKRIPPVARARTKLSMRRKVIDEIMSNREQDIEDFVQSIMSPEAQREFELFLKHGT